MKHLSRILLACFASSCIANMLNASPQEIITYPQIVDIDEKDSGDEILRKAAQLKPHPRQLKYHQEEYIGFIHFGVNTFTGREWGNGKEQAVMFNPEGLVDTDQWCRVMKEGGMTKIMMTVKHHDGFCLWQTRYNDRFSVISSPWKNGRGDVFRQLSISAKKYGLKLGVYISPADLYQIESKEGLYGNLSSSQDSVIPTDPKYFKSQPTKQRNINPAWPTFKVKCDDYNRYMLNQLYEVLTEYGPIHEVWFDGAHPKRKGGQTYVKQEWFKLIRALQPQAVIFGGPDVRWCGNERGDTRVSEWNTLGVKSVDTISLDRRDEVLGSDDILKSKTFLVKGTEHPANHLAYLISEVDTSIRHGWFWRNDREQKVRDADEVFDIYERSVGTGTVLLLNVPPNKYGKFSSRDVKCMLDVGARIRSTYGTDLSAGAKSVSEKLFDNNIVTYWQAQNLKDAFEVTFPQARLINRIVLQEAVSEVGQRVKDHAIDVWRNQRWEEIATATTIGYKRILRFPDITCQKLRVRINDSRALPAAIASFSAHHYDAPPSSLSFKRDLEGRVFLTAQVPEASEIIRYTIDGSEPNLKSPIYKGSIHLPNGAHLKACSFVGQDAGPILEQHFGLAKQGWKITSTSEVDEKTAFNAIDGDDKTYWISHHETSQKHPHQLTIEVPTIHTIHGFSYLPRQDRRIPDGMIEVARLESSINGKDWQKIDDFTFGNLVNSPDERIKLFKKPAKAKFIRFTSLEGADGSPVASAAEIGIFIQ